MSNNDESKAIRPVRHQVADYLEVAEWSDEDGCYVGSVPPLVGPSCDRSLTDVADLFPELDQIAEEYLQIFEEDGFPVPPPFEAGLYEAKYFRPTGKRIFRCRLLDASRQVLSDGIFQNEGGVHKPCFMPLPRAAPLSDAVHSLGAYLRFSSTLTVPIGGLKLLSNGNFEVTGCPVFTSTEDVSSLSNGTVSEKVLHLN